MNASVKHDFIEQKNALSSLARQRNFWLMLLCDGMVIALAHVMAYLLRFEWTINQTAIGQILTIMPLLFAIKLPVFYICDLYRGMWRYTSIGDVVNIMKAVVISSSIIIWTILYLNRFSGYSRTVFFLDGIFTFLLLCLDRGLIRYLFQNKQSLRHLFQNDSPPRKKRLLMIGAGGAAEKMIREIHENPNIPYQVVGLIDDDPKKRGLKIHTIPVLGPTSNLPEAVVRTRAEELLIAIAAISAEDMKKVIAACQRTKIPFKVLPDLGEIIKGTLTVSSMREVSYKDLLGRQETHLDEREIGRYLTGQVILVTGAGGSIGSEICRQIVRFDPKKIILFDAGEENLYKIQMELHHTLHFENYLPVLGKIQNRALLDSLFCQHAPSVVFHAAAYKHVPLIESNPWEAIFNNVFAVRNLIETAIFHKAGRFVLVSTDKAVRPTNVMGASKRLTELLMLAYCQGQRNGATGTGRSDSPGCASAGAPDAQTRGNTIFMAVRFGNVLGSSGSVVPLFKRQIEKGGPVTVTHPEITRYFMSIEEAAQLVLQAGAMGKGGEIFLLKMGKPVKIDDLARDLIRLMGKEPEIDIPIVYSGLRPGEKLYEELITAGEGIVPTGHEKIMVLKGNGKLYQEMEALLSALAGAAKNHDAAAIKEILQKLLPEYTPDQEAVPVIHAMPQETDE